jgi:Flp pilus assembly protein protease CpaA
MFVISFYIFSLLLSYTDFKRFIVPNNIVIAMTVMMLSFGFLESKIYISSILLSLLVLLFFVIIILLKRDLILGGGDIKYMMLIALYLDVQSFALFLVFTGILQTLSLLYVQKIAKRKIAPMVPFMFLSVFVVDVLVAFKIYPF